MENQPLVVGDRLGDRNVALNDVADRVANNRPRQSADFAAAPRVQFGVECRQETEPVAPAISFARRPDTAGTAGRIADGNGRSILQLGNRCVACGSRLTTHSVMLAPGPSASFPHDAQAFYKRV